MKIAVAAMTILLMGGPALAQTAPAGDPNSRLIESRAVEAMIWGMPAVNTDLMLASP